MAFNWDETKNSVLKRERHISFERIVIAIEDGDIIDILEHPNTKKYPNQYIIIVEIEGYAYCIPCIEEKNGDFFMKTIFPSRKYTQKYHLRG